MQCKLFWTKTSAKCINVCVLLLKKKNVNNQFHWQLYIYIHTIIWNAYIVLWRFSRLCNNGNVSADTPAVWRHVTRSTRHVTRRYSLNRTVDALRHSTWETYVEVHGATICFIHTCSDNYTVSNSTASNM